MGLSAGKALKPSPGEAARGNPEVAVAEAAGVGGVSERDGKPLDAAPVAEAAGAGAGEAAGAEAGDGVAKGVAREGKAEPRLRPPSLGAGAGVALDSEAEAALEAAAGVAEGVSEGKPVLRPAVGAPPSPDIGCFFQSEMPESESADG